MYAQNAPGIVQKKESTAVMIECFIQLAYGLEPIKILYLHLLCFLNGFATNLD